MRIGREYRGECQSGRRIGRLLLGALLVGGLPAAVGTWSQVASAQAGACGADGAFSSSGGIDTCTYSDGGTEGTFSVPRGLTTMEVTAVGGAGGHGGFSELGGFGSGGSGAVVANSALEVPSGATLYVDVGQDGQNGTLASGSALDPGGTGGIRDGGAGGTGIYNYSSCEGDCDFQYGSGGGGGGSSDISLEPPSGSNLTGDPGTDPRLLVAGGGGGGGSGINFQGTPLQSGSGGSAGDATVVGAGVGGSCSGSLSGAAGGVGGPAGPACGGGTAGSASVAGTGDGATAGSSRVSGAGGGGGGWFGGGGGSLTGGAAGGGGGGSSYGGASGPVSVTTAATGQQPSVAISWEPPTIIGFSPSSGPRGSRVKVRGTNLMGATKVTVGGVAATILSDTDTLIRIQVPAAAATGKIKVTTPFGTAKSATSFRVT